MLLIQVDCRLDRPSHTCLAHVQLSTNSQKPADRCGNTPEIEDPEQQAWSGE
ncbi:MAG: hypothetical protein R3B74_06600 [Nitrospirales bacterium]|nr:hypothetical protein [Nitrospirales bacterium]